ncbi:signal peptidase I [Fictibacillus barbaricus]|uniref:Signal peptidase I n=2 Tax=Fictibacillus barbaricus TaxID=182136 RepID=A0ABU1U616_9BACL|nr:signal peptidase I [Fictibacillus barbaricus]
MMEQEKNTKPRNEWMSWIKAIVFALAFVFITKTYFFAPYLVEGASMSPTLHDQEKLYVNKIVYAFSEPKKGDIVIIKGDDKRYVKRIIGVEGDVIQMRNDVLYVNNKKIPESYLKENKSEAKSLGVYLTEDFGPLKVPKGKAFVMGDNRLNSMDSRNGLGLIELNSIEGRTEVVIYPFSDIRTTQ